MGQMMKLLKEKDPVLHKHLVSGLLISVLNKSLSVLLTVAKGGHGPNFLWISLDNFASLSGISPSR